MIDPLAWVSHITNPILGLWTWPFPAYSKKHRPMFLVTLQAWIPYSLSWLFHLMMHRLYSWPSDGGSWKVDKLWVLLFR